MNKYTIATNIALANLDTFVGWMSAAQQREIFGANVFGKKNITICNENQGTVEVRYSAAYGTDQVLTTVSFDEIAAAVNTNRALSL